MNGPVLTAKLLEKAVQDVQSVCSRFEDDDAKGACAEIVTALHSSTAGAAACDPRLLSETNVTRVLNALECWQSAWCIMLRLPAQRFDADLVRWATHVRLSVYRDACVRLACERGCWVNIDTESFFRSGELPLYRYLLDAWTPLRCRCGLPGFACPLLCLRAYDVRYEAVLARARDVASGASVMLVACTGLVREIAAVCISYACCPGFSPICRPL